MQLIAQPRLADHAVARLADVHRAEAGGAGDLREGCRQRVGYIRPAAVPIFLAEANEPIGRLQPEGLHRHVLDRGAQHIEAGRAVLGHADHVEGAAFTDQLVLAARAAPARADAIGVGAARATVVLPLVASGVGSQEVQLDRADRDVHAAVNRKSHDSDRHKRG